METLSSLHMFGEESILSVLQDCFGLGQHFVSLPKESIFLEALSLGWEAHALLREGQLIANILITILGESNTADHL